MDWGIYSSQCRGSNLCLVMDDSPAMRAGLQDGRCASEVDGTAVIPEMSEQDVVRLSADRWANRNADYLQERYT